jgi:hypothetical protein
MDGSIIMDGSEFVSFYNNNRPVFNLDGIVDFLNPVPIDQDYLKYSGYKLNVKSIIFAEAKSDEIMKGYVLLTNSDTNRSIGTAYLETEIVYYECLLNGLNSYFFPTHELIKLFYWFSKSASIMNSKKKLRNIKQEIK